MTKFDLTYIIDDDPIFVLVLKKILTKMNHFPHIKNLVNGHEALIKLKEISNSKEQFPDIIFLDLNMPVLDGWQFLDEIEKFSFKDKLKIYIVSSTIDTSEIEKAKNYKSVISFISKPTSATELARILKIA